MGITRWTTWLVRAREPVRWRGTSLSERELPRPRGHQKEVGSDGLITSWQALIKVPLIPLPLLYSQITLIVIYCRLTTFPCYSSLQITILPSHSNIIYTQTYFLVLPILLVASYTVNKSHKGTQPICLSFEGVGSNYILYYIKLFYHWWGLLLSTH